MPRPSPDSTGLRAAPGLRWTRSRSFLATALLAGLAASCSVPLTPPPPLPQGPPVSAATWAQVGAAARHASAVARGEAEAYARQAVAEWIARVRERTATELIPWLTAYWTQQWLSLKLAWYRMNDAERDAAAATERLGEYLQEEFRSRVLEPVAKDIDPEQIMHRVTAHYVRVLAQGLRALPARFGVPEPELDQWLGSVPAITSPPGATLRELTRGGDPTDLAAYRALARGVQERREVSHPREAMQAYARRIAERLSPALALRGGATAASLAGGLPGLLVGLGVTAWDASRYDQERPALVASLQEGLDAALRAAAQDHLADPEAGVLGAVTHIASQLEAGLPMDEGGHCGSDLEDLW